MPKTITVDNKKLLQQFAEIGKLAKEKKWSFYYDDELDSLYFSPKKIGVNFSLHSLRGDISVYVDDKSNLGGLFIEYYKTSRIYHLTTAPASEKNKVTVLSEMIKADLLTDMVKEVQAGHLKVGTPA